MYSCSARRISFQIDQFEFDLKRNSLGLGTGHYLYPRLGLKRNYFELKNYIYPTINSRKFSNTPLFFSLKNKYPTFPNTFFILPIFSSPLPGILVWAILFRFANLTFVVFYKFLLPNLCYTLFFHYPTL